MRRPTSRSITKLWALAMCAPLLVPACSTEYSDQPVKAGNLSAAEISMLDPSALAVLDGSGAAGLNLTTLLEPEARPLFRMRLDGHYVTLSSTPTDYIRIQTAGAFMTMSNRWDFTTNRAPGGFPAGIHTLTLERDDGSTFLSTTQDFAAGAFNTIVIRGTLREPILTFFSDAVPADPSLHIVRLMNVMENQEPLTVTSCLGPSPCTPAQIPLAYGESWVTTLADTDAPPQVVFPQEAITCDLLYAVAPPAPRVLFYPLLQPGTMCTTPNLP